MCEFSKNSLCCYLRKYSTSAYWKSTLTKYFNIYDACKHFNFWGGFCYGKMKNCQSFFSLKLKIEWDKDSFKNFFKESLVVPCIIYVCFYFTEVVAGVVFKEAMPIEIEPIVYRSVTTRNLWKYRSYPWTQNYLDPIFPCETRQTFLNESLLNTETSIFYMQYA